MANDEHVAMLKKGVDAWNEWRDLNKSIPPNLAGATLARAKLDRVNLTGTIRSEANLVFATLSGANLREATLSGANLVWATLIEADLRGANLGGADLRGANLTGANLVWATLIEANLRGANLGGADLRGANLTGATLIEANLREADLREADLGGADLRGANLDGADLRGADLRGAKLVWAKLGGAFLSGANLGGADLRGANLSYLATGTQATLLEANLARADLRGADLRRANLTGANLLTADLTEANLTGAILIGADLTEVLLRGTVFGATTLSEVKGLDQCIHWGPSIFDFQTLKNSGPLPIAFLRGLGLPDNLIEYLPSLLNEPIQFYSCFISYSGKDEAFAGRLHADLQKKGVRCWFAPHDMRIGAKLIDAIDEAIRLRDKVLLILSEGAIASDWVEGEVTTTLDEERTRKRVVLFPVRIDDAVMQASEAWARLLRGQRNIGDFSRWKEHDSYQKSFERLMRDLRIET